MPNYYNSRLIGNDRTIDNCHKVYANLEGYNIFVIGSCGNGMDASCNKRIKYTGNGGIDTVRNAFEDVIETLRLRLSYSVKS